MRRRRAVPSGQARSASRTSLASFGGAVGSATKGGGLLCVRSTSERVASVRPTVMPAAAAATAPTITQTRCRGLIRCDRIRAVIAIFRKAMPTYRELLQQVRSEIAEIDAAHARDLVDSGEP